MLFCQKYGRILNLPMTVKRLSSVHNSFISRITYKGLRIHEYSGYKSSLSRAFCTVNKEASVSKDEEKKNKAKQNEKKLIDTSLNKHKALQDNAKEKTSKIELWRFIRPYLYSDGKKGVFYLAMGCMVLSKVLAISAPYFLGMAVNSLANSSMYNTAIMSVAGFGLCRALTSYFHELRMSLIVKILREAIQNISLHIFSHLHHLDLTFHKTSTKNTIFAVNKALEAMDSGARFLIGFITPTVLEFTLICGMLAYYCGPLYVLNICLMLGLYTKFTHSYSKVRQGYIRDKRNQDKKADFFLNESILNYDTVKYFGNEKLEYNRYHRIQQEINRSSMKVQYSLANLNAGQQLIFALGMTINLMMACSDIFNGILTPGDFVMIQALFFQIAQPLHFMGTILRGIDESQVNSEDLFNILKMQKAVVENKDAKEFEFKKGEIEFKNIKYSYVKDETKTGEEVKETLFQGINFKLKGGCSNAIVGPSGFGKTTIFNLIYRIMDADEGEILIDGQNIKDLKINSFRNRISIVPQNGILFNDSIRFNLQYGNTSASQEDIERVCKQCNIHDRIMEMPDGYDTHVGDLGGKLSGGERQRILIARALLKDFDIILLDEATSSLDSKNEKSIIETLERNVHGKTIIYCAHRLSSIMNCDNIIVVGNGKVEEQGNHEELITKPNSKYSQMWKDFLRTSEECEIDDRISQIKDQVKLKA